MTVQDGLIDFIYTRKKATQQDFYDFKREKLGIYKALLLQMYDEGYTTEMTVYKEEDFLKAYIQEGVNLNFLSGRVIVEPWVFYLEWLLSDGENDFYFKMWELLEARALVQSIDFLWEKLRMFKTRTYKSLQWGFLYNKKGFRPFEPYEGFPYLYEMLVPEGYKLALDPLPHPLITTLKEKYNTTHLSGIPLEELAPYLEDILLGGLDFFQPTVDKLIKEPNFLEDLYAWSKEFTLQYVFDNYSDSEDLFALTNECAMRVVPKTDQYLGQVSFGAYTLDYDTGTPLPVTNNFYGLTADVIRVSSPTLQEEGITPYGCPFVLETGEGLDLFYDVEQVQGLGGSSLIFDLGLDLTLEEKGSSSLFNGPTLSEFYVDSYLLAEEGTFIRDLEGNYTKEEHYNALLEAFEAIHAT